MSEVRPCAVDWKRVIPRNPVKVKAMKLKPAAWPRLSWRVPPSRNIMAKGKMSAPTNLPGSRMNFVRSRAAIAATAFSSLIAGRQDPEIGVFQSRRLGSEQCQRFVDGSHNLMCGAAVQVDHEDAVLAEWDLHLE